MTALATGPSSSTSADASASALEVGYLRPVLEALPPAWKFALDVGAHKGEVTAALADLGFKVLAIEPQDYMADRFARRHAERMEAGMIRLARCAASDHRGEADLIIGSASTLSTLEPDWTSRGFPEEFHTRRSVRVPLLPLSDLLRKEEFGPVGFAKIDVEGHELPALRGLFGPAVTPPRMVMFEACQRFETEAEDCLAFLTAQGYRTFDIFIRIGPDPVAAERFTRASLPAVWHACERFFYANIIAYHESFVPAVELPDPVQFVRDYEPVAPETNATADAVKDSGAMKEDGVKSDSPSWFADDLARFRELSRHQDRGLPLNAGELQPCLDDRTPSCGFDRHYVYHTAWAARILARTRPARHVDISGTLYFSAIASAFVPVDYYEFRPANLALENLTTAVADLQRLPFPDASIASISCMHVIEHVGLGRYGDPVDPDGDLQAIAELSRVLAPGGSLLFVVPVGRPRVVFNAHRIYSSAQVRGYFGELALQEFALIPDGRHNKGLMLNPSEEFVNAQNYGCGCFWFRRSRS
jgi:FkbM family methyltransferase